MPYYKYYNYKVKFSTNCIYCNYPNSKNILLDDETFRICSNLICSKEFRATVTKKKIR
jgi:hypothetical protein